MGRQLCAAPFDAPCRRHRQLCAASPLSPKTGNVSIWILCVGNFALRVAQGSGHFFGRVSFTVPWALCSLLARFLELRYRPAVDLADPAFGESQNLANLPQSFVLVEVEADNQALLGVEFFDRLFAKLLLFG